MQRNHRRPSNSSPWKGFESGGKFIESTIPEAERGRPPTSSSRSSKAPASRPGATASAGQPPRRDERRRARCCATPSTTTSDSLHYGAPVYLQLDGFEECAPPCCRSPARRASPIVYLGALLLVLGVFAMLYIRERRLFVLMKPLARP